ncbi:hypothetical protein AAG927_008025 [Enterobacter hormaechei]
MPRRKQRQLTQKVRVGAVQAEENDVIAVEAAESTTGTQVAKVDLPAVVENQVEQDESSENRDNAGMPRRSRRSPRHLRVSGQRRRRYRDERYPTQSPMPLTVACASPEMASGKVWIRYPVARPEQAVEEQTVTEEVIAPIAAVEDVVTEAATVVEPQVVDTAAPQAVEVETTHPEVIAAPVDAAPQIIAEEDTVVAEEVAEDAEPVSAAEETADVAVETVTEEVVQDVEIQVEPVVEEVKAPEVKSEPIEVVAAVAPAHVATAPMTRAPAPEYVPEAPRHSDWVRPAFNFEGKGAAGGHSATHMATAPATRPQPVE